MTSTTGRSADTVLRPRGFTLFELVLVMLIVSVIAAIAAPSLRGFIAGRKNAEAAAQIIALGQYAREQAVGTGAVYRLNVDPAGRAYWLSVQNGAEFQTVRSEFGRPFRLPEGTVASWQPGAASGEYFQFWPDGRIEASPLQLRGVGRDSIAIGCRSETEFLTILRQELP